MGGGGAGESREFFPEVGLFPREAQHCLGILQTEVLVPALPHPNWWPLLSGTSGKSLLLLFSLIMMTGPFLSPHQAPRKCTPALAHIILTMAPWGYSPISQPQQKHPS